MKVVILGIFIGAAAGLVGALCGVGGGIFMVPMFVSFLGLTQKEAVATSLAVVIFTSLASTVSNAMAAKPLIQWPLFFAAAGSSVVFSWFMSEKMKSMSDESLSRIFAIVLISVGVWMWFSPAGKGKSSPPPPGAGAPPQQ